MAACFFFLKTNIKYQKQEKTETPAELIQMQLRSRSRSKIDKKAIMVPMSRPKLFFLKVRGHVNYSCDFMCMYNSEPVTSQTEIVGLFFNRVISTNSNYLISIIRPVVFIINAKVTNKLTKISLAGAIKS